MSNVIADERRDAIENLVLGLEQVDDVRKLVQLLAGRTRNVFEDPGDDDDAWKPVFSKI